MEALKKIVILGPESTGKSTLCESLAQHYNTQWCPEFAREYLLTHGMDYTFDDLLFVAKGQLAMEDEYVESVGGSSEFRSNNPILNPELRIQTPKLLFIDTDMYVMKVWCEFVFGKCHKWILEQIVKRKYDLYLLCNTDLPWVKDELREYPDLKSRDTLFQMYKDAMINQSVPWIDISGNYDERLQKAIAAVDGLMKG